MTQRVQNWKFYGRHAAGLAARPWIGGGNDVDPTTIDAELGSELETGARAGWEDKQ